MMVKETPSSHWNEWTLQDVRRLEKVANQDTPTGLIAHELGRTEDAVFSKASEEGVSLKPANQSPYNHRSNKDEHRQRRKPMRYDHLSEATIVAHERQRRLPAEAHRALVGGLCAHLRGRGRCLDAGVGTGSVALPLVRAGIPVVGVDLSRPMLDALRAKCGGAAALPLIRGDLTRLPIREGAFGAALAANVFHLITAWRAAVAELVRVVRSGGLLLVNLGSGGPATGRDALVHAKSREFLGGA